MFGSEYEKHNGRHCSEWFLQWIIMFRLKLCILRHFVCERCLAGWEKIWLCLVCPSKEKRRQNRKKRNETLNRRFYFVALANYSIEDDEQNCARHTVIIIIMINLYQKTFIHNGDWFVSSVCCPYFTTRTHSSTSHTLSLVTRISCAFSIQNDDKFWLNLINDPNESQHFCWCVRVQILRIEFFILRFAALKPRARITTWLCNNT